MNSLRVYKYRILLVRNSNQNSVPLKVFYSDLAWIIYDRDFSVEKFRDACKVFEGHHSFKNFVKVDARDPDPLDYFRTIKNVDVKICSPELVHSNYEETVILETTIISKSFLWH